MNFAGTVGNRVAGRVADAAASGIVNAAATALLDPGAGEHDGQLAVVSARGELERGRLWQRAAPWLGIAAGAAILVAMSSSRPLSTRSRSPGGESV